MSSPSPSSPSSPSFLLRLRTRTRRPATEVGVLLPEDHWHAGDPRLLDGSLALSATELPGPRRPVDRSRPTTAGPATGARAHLSAVPEVDLREGPGVVDLRGRAQQPPTWSETSTWLG